MTAINPPAELLDVAALRRQFPVLAVRVHGKPLVYFDNAATTQKPQVVIDRLTGFYAAENANVHRAVHTLSQRATNAYEHARRRVQQFLNAANAREIVFVRGTTEAINLVAHSYGRAHLEAGDEVIVSVMEHHSNIVPWQIVCGEKRARLRVIPMTDAGTLELDAFDRMLNDRTRFVSIVHVSNALGVINPVREIVERAHRRGIPVLVDGAQAVAHMKVDVQALGCDFYVASGHKMFGPTGIGVLYGKAALLEAMPPYQGGGDMIRTVTFDETQYNVLPYKFEAGTPDIAGAAGLATAIDFLAEVGLDRIEAYERQLLAYANDALSRVPGLRLVGTASPKSCVLSFVLDDVHPHDIGTILDREGVAIRTGHHCCQPLMERLGVTATARVSLAFYNTRDEIDLMISGLRRAGTYLRDLYQDAVLEHARRPRNLRRIEGARSVERMNPLCGDRLTLYARVENGVVTDASFDGRGCAISNASASLVTEAVRGKPVGEACALVARLRHLVGTPPGAASDDLGVLSALAGVREFPARIECAALAWEALDELLTERDAADPRDPCPVINGPQGIPEALPH